MSQVELSQRFRRFGSARCRFRKFESKKYVFIGGKRIDKTSVHRVIQDIADAKRDVFRSKTIQDRCEELRRDHDIDITQHLRWEDIVLCLSVMMHLHIQKVHEDGVVDAFSIVENATEEELQASVLCFFDDSHLHMLRELMATRDTANYYSWVINCMMTHYAREYVRMFDTAVERMKENSWVLDFAPESSDSHRRSKEWEPLDPSLAPKSWSKVEPLDPSLAPKSWSKVEPLNPSLVPKSWSKVEPLNPSLAPRSRSAFRSKDDEDDRDHDYYEYDRDYEYDREYVHGSRPSDYSSDYSDDYSSDYSDDYESHVYPTH